MFYCTLVIPSRQHNHALCDPITLSRCVRESELAIATLTGGCTTLRGYGTWIDPQGSIHRERLRVLCTYTDKDTIGDLLRGLASDVKVLLNQESVMVTINHFPEFI